MRAFLMGILATLGASVPAHAITAVAGCPMPMPASSLTTTFRSDFTRATNLDPKQWAPFAGQSLGDPAIEAQAYDPAQVDIEPTVGLRISTAPGALLGKGYRSGALTTKGLFSQAYGRFEMMARLPQANGLWPAFWLLPTDGKWPPEIDIIEFIYAPNGVVPAASAATSQGRPGSNPATTLHWGTPALHSQTAPWVNSSIPQQMTYQDWDQAPAPAGWGSAYRGYHIYALDWQPKSITWMIDGSVVFCVLDPAPTDHRIPAGPMYMLINDAVSAGTKQSPQWAGYVEPDTPWPQTMDVAYVLVSRFEDQTVLDTPLAPLPEAVSTPAKETVTTVNGKIGRAEGRVLRTLSATSPDLCSSGTPDGFKAEPSAWKWTCVGSGGGSVDPTGLAFKAR